MKDYHGRLLDANLHVNAQIICQTSLTDMAIHFLKTELRVARRLNEKEHNRARFPALSLAHKY